MYVCGGVGWGGERESQKEKRKINSGKERWVERDLERRERERNKRKETKKEKQRAGNRWTDRRAWESVQTGTVGGLLVGLSAHKWKMG